MKPYYEEDGITIYHGDCREILPTFPDQSFDLVLTDPPYGVNMLRGDSKIKERITGDDIRLDLSWVSAYPAIVWGGNQFCHQLPISGGWLVWYKYAPDMAHHSQAELAWSNVTRTVRHYSQQFTGFMCAIDGSKQHPTQKPVDLMKWCIGFQLDAAIILDPFMGSGTTLVAAKQLGRKAVGIEIEEKYCEIAVKRLAQMELTFA